MKDKQYYINSYKELIEEDRQLYIEEHGNDEDWNFSEVEEDMNVDEIVGYYLVWHKDLDLYMWLYNLKVAPRKWVTDEYVTNILKGLFNK